MKDFYCPIGSLYIQHLNDQSPIERCLPGFWEIWSHRTDGYGLTFNKLPSFKKYAKDANYAKGEYVESHVKGSPWQLYQAKEAITNALQYINTVKWTKFTPGIVVGCRHLQRWTDKDFCHRR